jgi:NitT/TauT family transport system ATP-binding protein
MHNPAAETASVSAAASLQPLLQVDRVSLQYRTATAVVQATHQVSFDVHPADRFVLLGPSGCGKSTLLKAVAGFMPPAGGEIRLEASGASAGAGPHRGVPGFDQLPPWKTVKQNVMFPLLASRTLGKRKPPSAHYLEGRPGALCRCLSTRCRAA